MKYALLDQDGGIAQVSEVVAEGESQPPGAILLPEDFSIHQDVGRLYVKAGEIKLRPSRPSEFHSWSPDDEVWHENLPGVEKHYLAEVDQAAEACRGKYITSGFGQSMTYEAKYQEALVGDGPFLQAEAQALEMTVAEVASSVLTARDQWESFGAEIEASRLRAKKQIRAASTTAEMQAVATDLSLALNQL